MKGPTARILGALTVLGMLGSGPLLGDTRMEEVLRAYVEVWNSGELDRLDDLLTEDFRRHGVFGPADSRARLRQVIETSRRFYGGLSIEIYDVVASPEKGAMRWRFRGRWGPTRFELDSLNFGMYHFEDGKISEEWVLGNNMDFFRALGYRLTPPQHRIVPPPVEEPPGPPLVQRMQPRTAELAAWAEQTRSAAPKNAGALEISAEVACRLDLDGRAVGWLAPGTSVVLHLERGKHRVAAASLGGSVFVETEVALRRGETSSVRVEAPGRVVLQPRRRTVEDLETGLMWQMEDNGANLPQAAAEAYCRDLRQGEYADWRLPTIHELQSLHAPEMAEAKRYPTLGGIHLSDCCPWSSTPHGEFSWTYAFSMDMRYLQHPALGSHMRALCVRDTASPARGP